MLTLEVRGVTVTGSSHADFSKNYLQVCMAQRWTPSILGEMIPVRDSQTGKVVCCVSFNGRIWPVNPKGDHTDCLYSPPDGEGIHLSRPQYGTIRSNYNS